MDIEKYLGKTIIAWHYYNENFNSDESYYGTVQNTRCYVYPRLLKQNDGTYSYIDEDDFPTVGRIDVKLRGQLTAEELYDQVGDLVEIKLNSKPFSNTQANNWYTMQFNQQFYKDQSEIWIEKFKGKAFSQIIKTTSPMETISRNKCFEHTGIIYTNEIFVECEERLYGPFQYDLKDGNIYLNSKKENQHFISVYCRDEIDNYIFNIRDNLGDIAVSLVAKAAIQSPIEREEKIDWIDDEKLVEYLISILKGKETYTREQVRIIRNNITELMEQNKEMLLTSERKARMISLLNNVEEKDLLINQVVHVAIEDKALGTDLAKIICRDHFELIEQNSKEIKEYKDNIDVLQREYQELLDKLEKLKADESFITEEAKARQGEQIQQIQNEINSLIEQKEKLKSENDQLLQTIGEIKNIEELQRLKKEAEEKVKEAVTKRRIREEDLKEVEDKQKKLESELKTMLSSFNNETEIIMEKLNKNFLNQVMKELSDEKTDDIVKYDTSLLEKRHLNGDEIINHVIEFLQHKANRITTHNDVVNYLTCIAQGFITTFAGNPGTGKTSLCTLLAKALGLAGEKEGKRFVEISVERGWTSHKDFIGYFNPLTKQMEKSNVEVYDALEHIDQEFDDEIKAPLFILLDEANLSPVEHYWATFLRICDMDSTSQRTINLGGKTIWHISDNLRFLATVNFDHTTEELSPRFLDRSWIITLNPETIDDEFINQENVDNCEEIVSYNDFIEAFSVGKEDNIDENIITKWNSIKNIFKSNHMSIMPRNIKMVVNYCKVACKYMDRQTPETRFAPLDYAVSQKILPTINGTGEDYEKLIKELKEECNKTSMPICARLLDKMERKAEENMGFYQFFAQ